MKRLTTLLPALGAFLCLMALPAAAQGRRGGMGNPGGAPGQMGRPSATDRGSGMGQPGQATTRSSPHNSSTNASQAIQKSPELSSRLQTLLPAGTNLSTAASGFKNTGQFVAAIHASHNLNIPFASLKQQTLAQGSLGKAIQTLKPDMSKSERNKAVKRAESEAQQDIKAAGKTAS